MSIITKSETKHFMGSKSSKAKDRAYHKILHKRNLQIKHLCAKLNLARSVCQEFVEDHGKFCDCSFCQTAVTVLDKGHGKEERNA